MSLTSEQSTTTQRSGRSDEATQSRSRDSFAKALTRRPVPLLFLVLVGWLALGAFAQYFFCCNSAGLQGSLLIRDGDLTVAQSNENLRFAQQSAVPVIPADAQKAFESTTQYLNDHPEKVLVITGEQLTAENKAPQMSLAYQRANALKSTFMGLGLGKNAMATKAAINDDLKLLDNDTILGGVSFAVMDIPNRNLNIQTADGSFSMSAPDNLSFTKNSAEINRPIPDAVRDKSQQLVDYLKANPNMQLNITGWQGTEEKSDNDLALARAEILRDWWLSMGVPVDQLKVASAAPRGDLIFVGDSLLYGGADYSILKRDAATAENAGTDTPTTNSDSAKADDDQTAQARGTDGDANSAKPSDAPAKPDAVTVYFDYNSTTPKLASKKKELQAIVAYLAANPEVQAILTGHTDSKGTVTYNDALSEKRAKTVEQYFLKQKVNPKQLRTNAFGASKPAADNNSDKNMALNRRVEISLFNNQ